MIRMKILVHRLVHLLSPYFMFCICVLPHGATTGCALFYTDRSISSANLQGKTVSVLQEDHVKIEGRVTDKETHVPVPYASVGLEGTTLGTSTNLQGEFSMLVRRSILRTNTKIRISCVGYEVNSFSYVGQAFIAIELVPSRIQLKELIVTEKDLSPDQIVRKAFARIRRNYYRKPFVYKTFYRHYCKDDSVYGRLIEAAVDIYKRKGHRAVTARPGMKDEVRVTQLRRSLDSTRVNVSHTPIGLYSVMAVDPVSYQFKGTAEEAILSLGNPVSTLKHNLKDYVFELEGITTFDGSDVYKIAFSSKGDGIVLGSGALIKQKHQGTLYINFSDFAFVRVERSRYSYDTIRSVVTYQKSLGKYFLRHLTLDGNRFLDREKFRHSYHLDLLINEFKTKGFTKFRGKEPGKRELLETKYDSSFWNGYTILKETPLEENIVRDLGGQKSLKDQFAVHDSLAKISMLAEASDEAAFDRFREQSKGSRILYLDFWASWCGPCIREFSFEKKLLEKYRDQITFVLLSTDNDEKAWKRALTKYKLTQPGFINYRIGSQADYLRFFEVYSIPHYILIKKNGEFYSLDARRPSDPELITDFESLISEVDRR